MQRLIPKQASWSAMRADFQWPNWPDFNIPAAICDNWAAREPDRLALRHLDGAGRVDDWTYGRLKQASDRLALAMAAQGIGQGDRIAVLMPQHPAVILTHLAAGKLGAITVPIFAAFSGAALRYRLFDSGAAAVVCDAARADKVLDLQGDLPGLRTIWSIDRAPAPVRNIWSDIENAHGALQPARVGADDPAVMIYTSGTTGDPKGVLHAHRFLIGHLPSIETSHEGLPKPGDMGWTPADWAWIGGLMDMAMPCLYYGVPQLCYRMEKFDPDAAFHLIDRFGLKNLFLPPTALKLMRASGGQVATPVRSVSSGGESLGADLIDWGARALGGPINEIYGQTECNLITAHTGETMTRRPGTLGQPVPGFEVQIMGPDGPVPAGEMGEIAVRAPNPVMFLKYWNKPAETAAKFRDGWLLTGDLGVADGDGYITYHGRNDDVITSAGYRIGPSEIENCLTAHPSVVMAAVIGAPDPIRGEVVQAYVTIQGAAGKDLERELISMVREGVSPHVAPRSVTVIGDMPLTTTGKIMRRELRARFVQDGN